MQLRHARKEVNEVACTPGTSKREIDVNAAKELCERVLIPLPDRAGEQVRRTVLDQLSLSGHIVELRKNPPWSRWVPPGRRRERERVTATTDDRPDCA